MRVGDPTGIIRREIIKFLESQRKYDVHIRTDPNDQTKARQIRGFTTKCSKKNYMKELQH